MLNPNIYFGLKYVLPLLNEVKGFKHTSFIIIQSHRTIRSVKITLIVDHISIVRYFSNVLRYNHHTFGN